MANTPFLDLVKPAGTDKALVSVINSNSDKIDGGVSTLSEQIANINKWLPSTLQTSYDTIFDELTGANSFRYDLLSSSATSTPTNDVAVCFTTKRKTSSVTLGSQMAIDVSGRSFIRSYSSNDGSWTAWQQFATKSETANVIVLSNAITFTNNAAESFSFTNYKNCYLLAVYTNSGATSVLGDDHVTTWNFNKSTGALTITKTTAGAWSGSNGDVVFIRPNS